MRGRPQVDWIAIEGAYRSGQDSLRAIADAHGITEGAIRKRAKKDAWLRDPQGTKRERVRAQLSGGTQLGTQYASRTIDEEAAQDVSDMRSGLDVARRCMARLALFIDEVIEPKDVKVIVEANRIAVETIRHIRGLDEKTDVAAIVIERTYGR